MTKFRLDVVFVLVGYARVSSDTQVLDRQIDALNNAGVDVRNIYREKITGTIRERPELTRLLNELQEGDVVLVAELTRLSRSTKDLFRIVEQIEGKSAHIKSIKDTWLNTATPEGKLMFTIFAGLSQFERDLISERTKDGLKAAKARGRNGGRPSKRTDKELTVKALYNSGVKIAEVVRQTGLSRSTVGRIVKDIRVVVE